MLLKNTVFHENEEMLLEACDFCMALGEENITP